MPEKIKKIREMLGFSRREFAEKLDVRQTKIQDIETGKQKSNDIFLISIVNKLHVSPDWLLTGEGEMFCSGAGVGLLGEEQGLVQPRRCDACGQAFGLSEQIQAKQEALDLAKEAIQDKQEMLRQEKEIKGMKEAEIGRLVEENKTFQGEIKRLEAELEQEKQETARMEATVCVD